MVIKYFSSTEVFLFIQIWHSGQMSADNEYVLIEICNDIKGEVQ